MQLYIQRNDITKMQVDVIVNSTAPEPSHGKGVDFAVFSAGGKDLIEERKEKGCIKTTEVKYTTGYNLKANYVFHTVGPMMRSEELYESFLVKKTYENCFELADKLRVQSIAFPLISTGEFGFPKKIVLNDAVNAAKEYLKTHDIDIYIVVFDKEAYEVAKRYYDVESFIRTSDVIKQHKKEQIRNFLKRTLKSGLRREEELIHSAKMRALSFEGIVDDLDTDYKETLFELIHQSGMTDPEIYKAAHIDKRLFNKLRNKEDYNSSKRMLLSICFVLELDLYTIEDF